MRVVLQRVKEASVSIDGTVHGRIGKGFALLVGVSDTDGDEEVEYLTHKISKLRVFEDENGKLNLDINAVNGAILSISQSRYTRTPRRATGRVSQRLGNQRMPTKFINS